MHQKPRLTTVCLLLLTAVFSLSFLLLARQEMHRGESGSYTIRTERVAQSPTVPEKPLVNINTADGAALDTLPGIGPSLAETIIAHRSAHGPFAGPEELLEVSGIGLAKLEGLQDWIIWEETQ